MTKKTAKLPKNALVNLAKLALKYGECVDDEMEHGAYEAAVTVPFEFQDEDDYYGRHSEIVANGVKVWRKLENLAKRVLAAANAEDKGSASDAVWTATVTIRYENDPDCDGEYTRVFRTENAARMAVWGILEEHLDFHYGDDEDAPTGDALKAFIESCICHNGAYAQVNDLTIRVTINKQIIEG